MTSVRPQPHVIIEGDGALACKDRFWNCPPQNRLSRSLRINLDDIATVIKVTTHPL